MNLLTQRDGLALGICNGFQALIKLGLVPYGEIRELTAQDPTPDLQYAGQARILYGKYTGGFLQISVAGGGRTG